MPVRRVQEEVIPDVVSSMLVFGAEQLAHSLAQELRRCINSHEMAASSSSLLYPISLSPISHQSIPIFAISLSPLPHQSIPLRFAVVVCRRSFV